MDKALVEECVKNFLVAIGENPEREGLKDTPARVSRMCEEIFEGMNYSNDEIAAMFSKCFETAATDMVVVKDIPLFSFCEHHLALMYNMTASVAYLPNGKVLGLSKISRIAEMVGKRLQIQERLGNDIADVLSKACGSEDVLVVVQGEHSCVTMRGIKSRGSQTRTCSAKGKFKKDAALRSEAFTLMGLN